MITYDPGVSPGTSAAFTSPLLTRSRACSTVSAGSVAIVVPEASPTETMDSVTAAG